MGATGDTWNATGSLPERLRAVVSPNLVECRALLREQLELDGLPTTPQASAVDGGLEDRVKVLGEPRASRR